MSETEEFWAGPFGDSYAARNQGEELIQTKRAMFTRMLASTMAEPPLDVLEFGCNIGLNFAAMQRIPGLRSTMYYGVEINEQAAVAAGSFATQVWIHSMLDPERPWGSGYRLAMTCGTLIHVPPEQLPDAYSALYAASKRHILICEYHSPKPVEIEYRGNAGRLWKRDFAGEMLSLYDDLKVVDTSFFWRHDPEHRFDDVFAVLLEKRNE